MGILHHITEYLERQNSQTEIGVVLETAKEAQEAQELNAPPSVPSLPIPPSARNHLTIPPNWRELVDGWLPDDRRRWRENLAGCLAEFGDVEPTAAQRNDAGKMAYLLTIDWPEGSEP